MLNLIRGAADAASLLELLCAGHGNTVPAAAIAAEFLRKVRLDGVIGIVLGEIIYEFGSTMQRWKRIIASGDTLSVW